MKDGKAGETRGCTIVIHSMVEISNRHLTMEDTRFLKRCGQPWIQYSPELEVASTARGWIVRVADTFDEARDPSLAGAFRIARSLGCSHVIFDVETGAEMLALPLRQDHDLWPDEVG